MNAPIKTRIDYVAHSYSASYETKTLGEACHAIEAVEKTLQTLAAQLEKLRHCEDPRTRKAAHDWDLIILDGRHDTSWPGLIVAAQEAARDANVKPMLVAS